MKTLILVNKSLWRCGGSLVTGLINKMGASIGSCSKGPDVHNQIGYFENDALLNFQRKYFMPGLDIYDKRKNISEMKEIAEKNQEEFEQRCLINPFILTKFMLGTKSMPRCTR